MGKGLIGLLKQAFLSPVTDVPPSKYIEFNAQALLGLVAHIPRQRLDGLEDLSARWGVLCRVISETPGHRENQKTQELARHIAEITAAICDLKGKPFIAPRHSIEYISNNRDLISQLAISYEREDQQYLVRDSYKIPLGFEIFEEADGMGFPKPVKGGVILSVFAEKLQAALITPQPSSSPPDMSAAIVARYIATHGFHA